MKVNLRLLYLYLFAFVGLLIVVIGSVRLVELAMKVVVFGGADKYEYAMPNASAEEKMISEREQSRQRQRDVSGALAMIIVGGPLYWYHWRIIQKGESA